MTTLPTATPSGGKSARLALALSVAGAAWLGLSAAATEGLELPKPPSAESLLWNTSLSLRSWSGYKDNPRLSILNPAGSMLVGGGGELLVVRLPADGREFNFFASIDHTAYTQKGFDPETIAAVEARYQQSWGNGWQAGTAVEYIFLRQVFDASEIEGVPLVLPALGHTLTFRPSFAREWTDQWRVEVELEATRQWLAAPLDDYQDLAPKVTFARLLGKHRSLGLSYRWRERGFDERTPVDATGVAIPGSLAYQMNEVEVVWRHAWSQRDRWRLNVRPGWVRNTDNGGGFFDYDRFQWAAGVRFLGERWEVRLDGRARWYLYPTQTNGEADGTRRRRTDLSWMLRGDWKARPGVRCFGQYEMEVSDENHPAGDYHVNTLLAGVELEW